PRRVASFAYPESAARALGRAADRADWLRRPAGAVPELSGIDPGRAAEIVDSAVGERWLDAARTRELLSAYGIPVVEERVTRSADEAAAAAAELGYPAVVKTAEAGAHKTERDAIALDLADEAELRAAVERIGLPALVQPMVKS